LQVEFKKSEIHAIAKTLGQSIEAFQRQSVSEGKVNLIPFSFATISLLARDAPHSRGHCSKLERQHERKALLDYCGLDTLGMLRLLEKLQHSSV
jgi:hypothetical protein